MDDRFRSFVCPEAMTMVRLSTKAVFVLALVLVTDIGALCTRATAAEETQEETGILFQSDNVGELKTGHERQLKLGFPAIRTLFAGELNHVHLLASSVW